MKRKAGIVCCSNAISPGLKQEVDGLVRTMERLGVDIVLSDRVFSDEPRGHGTGRERAEALMAFYEDPQISEIYDISGGDIANELIPYLDFDKIRQSRKLLYGYSDLTVLLNAIYTAAGQEGILWQARKLVRSRGAYQCDRFEKDALFDFDYHFLQGTSMEGIVVGGNIRCFLKLAGTPYFPDLSGKLLLLEALGGEVPQMITYISQLKQLGAFEKIDGIILGTFTKMEQEGCSPSVAELIREAAPNLPIIKTEQIGHGPDSAAVRIGGFYRFGLPEKLQKK